MRSCARISPERPRDEPDRQYCDANSQKVTLHCALRFVVPMHDRCQPWLFRDKLEDVRQRAGLGRWAPHSGGPAGTRTQSPEWRGICSSQAASVARVCQLAASKPAIPFGPLLHGEAGRWQDRNRMAQDSARRELQPFMRGRRIAEPNDMGKPVAAVGPPGVVWVRLIISAAISRASTFAEARLGTGLIPGLRH